MTREEAAQWLINLKSEYDGKTWSKWAFEVFDMAIAALRGPDPDTGLVPCGCGCKPELRDEGRGWYQVYCTGCDMHGGNSHTPDGVIEEWNTAMGMKEGVE